MKKLISFFVGCALCCSALVAPTTIAGTSDSAAHQIASAGSATWIQFVAPSTNTGTVYIGGSGVNSTVGLPLIAGAGMLLPPISVSTNQNTTDRRYDLTQWYYLITSGDKLNITYVVQP